MNRFQLHGSVFATLIAGGLLLTQDGVTSGFLLDLIFYIIITPVISVTLTRIMFQSENAMIVDDALQRIDSVLNLKPLGIKESGNQVGKSCFPTAGRAYKSYGSFQL